ncbi:MAG: site-2 protease family protein [Bacteroidota bacterium]|nr:site-2 protease family protein [Bacteroidota bacterium]
MKNSLSIGKIAGIQIFIHWSFPLIILWIIFSNVRSGLNTEQIIWSVLFVLTLFVCVTLHELGHALAAKRFHIKTKDITLLPIGGVARLENMPEKPMQELIVALAGPAVNVIIFLILYIALQIASIPFDFTAITHITADNFLFNLAILNIWLAVFNMIPAFPMDGGRVLRALLAMKLNRSLATQIAGRIGQVIAMGFVLLGFFWKSFHDIYWHLYFSGSHDRNRNGKNTIRFKRPYHW